MLQQPHHTYSGYRRAGVRLREPLRTDLDSHRTERFGATLPAIHAFDKAHVVMLVESGLVDRPAGRRILAAVRRMEQAGVEETRMLAQGGEHSLEQFVTREDGEDVGGWMNLARSSGDLAEVSRRLTLRTRIRPALAALLELRETAIALAETHVDVVFPGQTFLQYAQPTSLGHWFGMWVEVFDRHTERLWELHARANSSPAGAAIFTGSDFPIDRERTADLLGFDTTLANTFDAIMSHDVMLEAQSVIAAIWNDLARLGDDLEQWMASDVRFVDVPDSFCGTSSVMPQKRNPMLPQRLKAQSAKALGMLTAGYLAERGSSGQTMLERYEPEAQLWELFDNLPPLVHGLTLLLDALEVDQERMLDAAWSSWSTASDLAGMIVRRTSISWRTAHQIVGILVRMTEDRGIHPRDVTTQLVDEAALAYWERPLNLSAEDVREGLDPVASVARRTLTGGAAPAAQASVRPAQAARIEEHRERLDALDRRLADADQRLEDAIDAILTD